MKINLKKLLTRVAGGVIERATAGIIDADDLIGDEDIEVEEEQLLQIVALRKQNVTIIEQNEQIINLLKQISQGTGRV